MADVNLRVLLKKYIDLIVSLEGHDYLNFVGGEFTAEEKAVLTEIAYGEDNLSKSS